MVCSVIKLALVTINSQSRVNSAGRQCVGDGKSASRSSGGDGRRHLPYVRPSRATDYPVNAAAQAALPAQEGARTQEKGRKGPARAVPLWPQRTEAVTDETHQKRRAKVFLGAGRGCGTKEVTLSSARCHPYGTSSASGSQFYPWPAPFEDRALAHFSNGILCTSGNRGTSGTPI